MSCWPGTTESKPISSQDTQVFGMTWFASQCVCHTSPEDERKHLWTGETHLDTGSPPSRQNETQRLGMFLGNLVPTSLHDEVQPKIYAFFCTAAKASENMANTERARGKKTNPHHCKKNCRRHVPPFPGHGSQESPAGSGRTCSEIETKVLRTATTSPLCWLSADDPSSHTLTKGKQNRTCQETKNIAVFDDFCPLRLSRQFVSTVIRCHYSGRPLQRPLAKNAMWPSGSVNSCVLTLCTPASRGTLDAVWPGPYSQHVKIRLDIKCPLSALGSASVS